MIFLDTNVVIWSYQGRQDLLTDKVKQFMDEDDLVVSPMVQLELQYLFEVGSAKVPAKTVLDQLYTSIGLTVHDHSFARVILACIGAKWTREPFDRIIASHAKALDSMLLTKDSNIRRHYKKAVW